VIEYNMPGFPPDPYGFTKAERLQWSKASVDYLLNYAPISFLGNLRFPEGQKAPPETCRTMDDCTRLFNDRELRHMLDVKKVVQAALNIWYISIGILMLLWVWAARRGWARDYRIGLRRGGWLTLLLVGSIMLFVLLAFGAIFVAFHNVFFETGTWQFPYSDTLIRLYPERFWRDTFLAVGILSGGAGLLLSLFVKEKVPQP
jgi:integral membrane protein (TIGR01906 family)